MIINENEFPVVVQAYKTEGVNDLFVAEQVVNNQTEADNFTARYAGFLIKAHTVHEEELEVGHSNTAKQKTRRRSGAAIWTTIVILLLVAIIVAGFTTGWIQRTFGVTFN